MRAGLGEVVMATNTSHVGAQAQPPVLRCINRGSSDTAIIVVSLQAKRKL
jgi:hypothetical protein